MIPMNQCVTRGVYWIQSRNLCVGVYDGEQGFIGIRNKFGSDYLFTEYHWDQGPPYGTVRPQEFVEMLPVDIDLFEGESRCRNCMSLTRFIRNSEEDWSAGGEWIHLRDVDCAEVRSMYFSNRPMFDYLMPLHQARVAELDLRL